MRTRLALLALVSSLLLVSIPASADPDYYDFMVRVDVDGTMQGWDAPYLRTLPFTPETGWTDGDRVAYRCGYGFLQHKGRIVGRVTFTRIREAASYAALNDRYMLDAVRYYDGTLNTNPDLHQLNDCPEPSEAYAPTTVSERPNVTYTLVDRRGTPISLLELRSYTNTDAGPDVTFETTLVTPQRVTVVASAKGIPFMVVYYDSLSPKVVMGSDT